MFAKVFGEILECIIIYQAIARVVVASNRFTCFFADQVHRRLWTGKLLAIMVAVSFALTVAVSAFRFPHPISYIFLPEGFVFVYYEEEAIVETRSKVCAIVYVVCSLLSLAFDSGTALTLLISRKRGHMSNIRNNPEVRLFFYSLVNFLFMLLVTLNQLEQAQLMNIPAVTAIVDNRIIGSYVFILSAYGSLGPVFLIALSPHVREKFLAFYGCCGRDSVIVLNSIRTQSIGELQANPA